MPTSRTIWYEPLSPCDTTFLSVESARAHMHIGGVSMLEGRAPAHRAFAEYVESRLDRIPRYRQRLAFVPLEIGRPVWTDDPQFRIERHVRHETATPPGGQEALEQVVARIFAEPLDRSAPLWELTLVDGVAEDRFALVWKTHHCMFDGIAFLDVIDALTDTGATACEPPKARQWTPRAAPLPAELFAASVNEQLTRLLDLAGRAPRVLDELRPLLALTLEGRARPSSLNQPIGPGRRWQTVTLALDDLKRVRSALGGTVNDVALAVVAGAMRRLLAARREALEPQLRVLVPVNVRRSDGGPSCGNEIGGAYCCLPVGESDPAARLRSISASMARVKERREAIGTAAFVRLAEVVPARIATDIARREVAYRRFNAIVSNLPGPQAPRYLLGRKLLSFHFAVPLADEQTVSIQFFSYAGSVGVGLLADAGCFPDLALLAAAFPEALSELLAAAASPSARASLVS